MRNLNSPLASLLLLALAVALPSSPAHAGKKFYKWQDEQGVWHYDEAKPKDRDASPIIVSQKGGSADSESPANPAPSSQPASNQQNTLNIAATDEDGENKVIATRREACERATTAVSIYENNARVSVDTDNDGVQEPLSTQQQVEMLRKARAQVKEYCN